MGAILPFISRVRDSGEWTAAERTRLEALTGQFFGGNEDLEVVFGATDDGDPWCVVMNRDEEVLLHVARIGDRFMVHFTADDVVAEGVDMRATLGKWLSEATEPQMGVVLPFNAVARTGQNMLVMLVATAFVEDMLKIAAPMIAAGEAATVSEGEAPPAPTGGETPAEHDPAPTRWDSLPDPAPEAPHAQTTEPAAAARSSAHMEAAAAAPQVIEEPETDSPEASRGSPDPQPAPRHDLPDEIRGGDGDDRLQGTARAERLFGGDGADTLNGGGGRDTLDGGNGDDRLELTSEAVAKGGEGADTFVVEVPANLHHPDTLLGVVLDFSLVEGDQLVTATGEKIDLPPAQPHQNGFNLQGLRSETSPTDQRISVDFDGDGQADGFVLLKAVPAHTALDETAASRTGQSFGWPDFAG